MRYERSSKDMFPPRVGSRGNRGRGGGEFVEEVSTRGEQRKRKQGGSHDCLAYCGGLKIEQVVAKLYGLSAYTVHKRLNKSLHDLSRVVWRNEIFEPCFSNFASPLVQSYAAPLLEKLAGLNETSTIEITRSRWVEKGEGLTIVEIDDWRVGDLKIEGSRNDKANLITLYHSSTREK